MPSITVAITAHNLEVYLQRCMDELFSQSFRDFEIVIYDDCSTDNTQSLLEECQRAHPEQIKVIFGATPLGSPARARNAILDSGEINGKYLTFLDGDDNIEPDFLEKLHQAAEYHDTDMAICAYDRFEEESGHILCQEMRGFPAVLELPPGNDSLAFINGSLWNKLIRTSIIGSLRIPDFRVGEDTAFLMALLDRCKILAFVDEILIHYRVRATSVISNTQEETIYQFAHELVRLRNSTAHIWMQDTLALVAFIHIGVSMPLRTYANTAINQKAVLNWITNYFSVEFQWFRDVRWLRLVSLCRHGIKGIGLWGAKLCYQLHCFTLFLALHRWITKTLHIDIKF